MKILSLICEKPNTILFDIVVNECVRNKQGLHFSLFLQDKILFWDGSSHKENWEQSYVSLYKESD